MREHQLQRSPTIGPACAQAKPALLVATALTPSRAAHGRRPHPKAETNLSYFIWSVTDLPRGGSTIGVFVNRDGTRDIGLGAGRRAAAADRHDRQLVATADEPTFLVYSTYETILADNRSHHYALSVAMLADRLR